MMIRTPSMEWIFTLSLLIIQQQWLWEKVTHWITCFTVFKKQNHYVRFPM